MFKILVRGLNILPLISHNRNINVIKWIDKTEFIIPLHNDDLNGKIDVQYDKDNLIIAFNKDGHKPNTDE